MTRQLDSRTTLGVLDGHDVARLARIPDEEQRGLAFRELLRRRGRTEEIADLSIAENALLYPSLSAKIFAGLPHPLPVHSTRYVPPQDTQRLTTAIAGQLAASFHAPVDPKDVYATAGVSSALEIIALALQTPARGGVPAPRGVDAVPVPRGSSVLIPAPYWQGFNWSFEEVPALRCVPVPTYKKGARPEDDTFELTVEDLEKAYLACAEPPRLLVLTNPHNPLGGNYPPELLHEVYAWALAKSPEMHVISDEIYRHSQLPHTTDRFVSGLRLAAEHGAPDRVHVVWGFAKDFGLSGFRTGFVVSRSPEVRQAMTDAGDPLERHRPLSWFSQFDALKQFYVEPIATLPVAGWHDLMAGYALDLQVSFRAVSDTLTTNGIRFHRPEGTNCAQFFWLDLREYLPLAPPPSGPEAVLFGDDPTDREQNLATYLLTEAKVKLLTGATMFQLDPRGFYRLCFTAAPAAVVVEAVERLCAALRKLLPRP
ncbi:pyridoxal phosphate-dependent aminotransferase [Actinosynnema sp. NPDC020468]|uniref:pyridoxal phosphate-dependent aminotransferase n=1 Tax=Actinosynnema sp. NPDC020468 TaxID=3154488 RepID=UPI0033D8F0D5